MAKNNYAFTGTVKKIFDEETFASGFNKRSFVVTESGDSKYPQDVQFDCLKDQVGMIANLKEGEQVTVHFDLQGREWNGRYFVNLKAWKVETHGQSASSEEPPAEPADEDRPF